MYIPEEVKAAMTIARTQLFSRCLVRIDGEGNWETTIFLTTLYTEQPDSGSLFYFLDVSYTPLRMNFYDMDILNERQMVARLQCRGIPTEKDKGLWNSNDPDVAFELIMPRLGTAKYILATRIPETHWRVFQVWVALRERLNAQERNADYLDIRDRVTAKVARLNKECLKNEASLRAMLPSFFVAQK